RLFAATSLLFLAVLAISPAKSALRSYRSVQRHYRQLGMARARSLKAARDYEQRPVAIQQVWLRDFENRVDRCTTCHLGVNDPLMKGASEPLRPHVQTAHTPSAFDRFGCTSCHGGQGPATSTEEAHGTERDAGPPMTPAAYLEAGCGRCHAPESVPEAPILSRGRAVMSRSGCYACHAVHGHENFRSHAPPLTSLAMKTGGMWLRRWLHGPRAVDPNATMPNFYLSEKETEELSHYLFNLPVPWDLAKHIRSAEEEPAGDPASGKKLFSEARCISCHTLEGKGNGSAPELSKIASSATRGWLLAFLRDPQAFYPSTKMPRFGFSETESRDVVAYMEDELRDFDAPKEMLVPIRVNQTLAENGEKLFRRAGCFACHSEPSGSEEKFGPELTGIGDKKAASLDFGRRTDLARTLPAWLAAKIASPRSFARGLRMPSYELNREDTRAVVTALLSLGVQPVPEAYRAAPPRVASVVPGGPVGALIGRYRCLSCHQIGEEGGDISTAPLTFEGSKVQRNWLADYLVLPYSLRPILEERMPVLHMSREEATQLADAFESFYLDPATPQDPFAGRPTSDADPVEGEHLYTALGCRACHIVGSSGGYYGPPLTNSGKRLKSGWIYTWLKGPQRWRADVRCPNYGLTDTDALRLTAYLSTLQSVPGSTPAGDAR
ncbi:MAG TPA: c-type cytochrome, partial [Thermoanaerobaculia bacterium]|nr:c-type cytochrome [Thermoanaerobaculia bacterium]